MLKTTEKFIAWQAEQPEPNDDQVCRSIDKYAILLKELKKRVDQKYIKMLQDDEEPDSSELSSNLSFGGAEHGDDEQSHSIDSYGSLDMDDLEETEIEGLSDEEDE